MLAKEGQRGKTGTESRVVRGLGWPASWVGMGRGSSTPYTGLGRVGSVIWWVDENRPSDNSGTDSFEFRRWYCYTDRIDCLFRASIQTEAQCCSVPPKQLGSCDPVARATPACPAECFARLISPSALMVGDRGPESDIGGLFLLTQSNPIHKISYIKWNW